MYRNFGFGGVRSIARIGTYGFVITGTIINYYSVFVLLSKVIQDEYK